VPERASSDWTQTDTIREAVGLPNARLIIDSGGREAARFGARISGTIMLFDAHGRQLYAGGITPARGTEGDNAGRNAIESLLKGQSFRGTVMPVFGCPLCLPPDHSSARDFVANPSKPTPVVESPSVSR
jgi:hypothetical protein